MARRLVDDDGDRVITHDFEHDHAVRRTTQRSRTAVLEQTAEERKLTEKQRFLGGYKVGSIPINDIPDVAKKYPELFVDCDQDIKKKALIRFSLDPDMRPYIVRRA